MSETPDVPSEIPQAMRDTLRDEAKRRIKVAGHLEPELLPMRPASVLALLDFYEELLAEVQRVREREAQAVKDALTEAEQVLKREDSDMGWVQGESPLPADNPSEQHYRGARYGFREAARIVADLRDRSEQEATGDHPLAKTNWYQRFCDQEKHNIASRRALCEQLDQLTAENQELRKRLVALSTIATIQRYGEALKKLGET